MLYNDQSTLNQVFVQILFSTASQVIHSQRVQNPHFKNNFLQYFFVSFLHFYV